MVFDCRPFIEFCKASCCTHRIHNARFWKVKSHFAENVLKVEYIANKACITTTDGYCPFLCRINHRCKIYDDRPTICRNYGEKKDIPCAYQGTLGFKRSLAKRTKLLRKLKNGSRLDKKTHRQIKTNP